MCHIAGDFWATDECTYAEKRDTYNLFENRQFFFSLVGISNFNCFLPSTTRKPIIKIQIL